MVQIDAVAATGTDVAAAAAAGGVQQAVRRKRPQLAKH